MTLRRCLLVSFGGAMIGLILKVLVLSAGLSIAIKYGAPGLAIPLTTTSVLLAVWLPATIAALALGWRWQQGRTHRQRGERSA